MVSKHLRKRIAQLLNQARVISEASAGQVAISRTHPGSRLLHSPGPSTLARLGARLPEIRTDRDAEEWITWAEDELRQVTHGPDRQAETPEQFRYRINTEYEGVPAPVVARRELTSVTTVRKLRTEDGRDPRRGHKLPDAPS